MTQIISVLYMGWRACLDDAVNRNEEFKNFEYFCARADDPGNPTPAKGPLGQSREGFVKIYFGS